MAQKRGVSAEQKDTIHSTTTNHDSSHLHRLRPNCVNKSESLILLLELPTIVPFLQLTTFSTLYPSEEVLTSYFEPYIKAIQLIQSQSKHQIIKRVYYMDFWNHRPKNPFAEIKRLAQSLTSHSSHSAVQKLIVIFNNLFPTLNQSLLTNLYEESFKSKPICEQNFACALQLLDPKSQIGKTILANKDAKIQLDNLHFSNDFQSYLRQSELANILKKQECSYRIPVLQCFLISLTVNLIGLKDQQRKVQWETAFYQSEFYYFIVRNPILLILKNWLTSVRAHTPIFNRVINVVQIILLRDTTNEMKKRERYIVKNTVIYAIYIISEWKVGVYHWEFLQLVSENLLKKSNNSELLTLWIEINLSILMNATDFQQQIRSAIRQFNSKKPQSTLKLFENLQSLKAQNFEQIDIKNFTSFVYKVESLVKRKFWSCSASFLRSIFIIICITKSNIVSLEQQKYMLNSFKSIFKRSPPNLKLEKEKAIFDNIKNQFQKINSGQRSYEEQDEYFEEQSTGNKRLTNLRKQNENSHISQRKSLLVHQDTQHFSEWMKPVQSNQSYLLFQITKRIAANIDKILKRQPIKQKNTDKIFPKTNIRFFASWFGFFCLLIVLYLSSKILKSII